MRLPNPIRTLRGALDARRKAYQREAVMFSQGIGLGGLGHVSQVTDATYVQAYSLNPWVYACVHAIATAVATVPFVVERETRPDEWEPVEGHPPLANLLTHVNADDSAYMLLEGTAASLALHGNAYWLLLRASEGRAPSAIQLLPPDTVTPLPGRGKRSQIIRGYKVRLTNGRDITVDDDDIVHAKLYSPTDQFVGQPPTKAAEASINGWTYASEFNKQFMKRGGLPGGILKTEYELDEAKRADLRAQWEQWRARPGNDAPLLLSASLTFEAIGISPDQTVSLDYPARLREEICACYGVPPAIVGIYEYANYANAELQRKLFWADTVSDYLPRIAGAVNEQLAWQFEGGPWRVRPDLSSVEALQADKQLEAQRRREDVRAGLMTINEAREAEGKPPVPWGDEWWGPLSTVPLAGPEGALATPAPAPVAAPRAEDAGEGQARARITIRAAKRRTPEAGRRAISALINRHRNTYIRPMREAVAAWYDTLAEDMLARLDQLNLPPVRAKDPRLSALLFLVDDAAADLAQRVMPLFGSLAQTTGQELLGVFELDIAFNLDSRPMQDLIAGRTFAMRTVAENAHERVYQSLADGLAQSETIPQLRERVLEFAEQGKEQYAETVARTETGIAANAAARESYQQAGADGIEWVAVLDQATRPTHAAINGTIIALGAQFSLGGIACDGPGDPALPPEEICNCRCVTAPVFGEEEAA